MKPEGSGEDPDPEEHPEAYQVRVDFRNAETGALLDQSNSKTYSGLSKAAHTFTPVAEAQTDTATAHYAVSYTHLVHEACPAVEPMPAGERYPARALLKRGLYAKGNTTGFIGVQACAALASFLENGTPQTETVVTVAGDAVPHPYNPVSYTHLDRRSARGTVCPLCACGKRCF